MKTLYRKFCYWIHANQETAISLAYASGLCMWVLQLWWLYLTKGLQ